MKLRILITGHTLIDFIHYKNDITIQPGGLIFSVAGIQAFLTDNDELFVCTSIEKKYEDVLKPYYKKINKKYVNYLERMSKNNLYLFDDKEREEKYEYIAPPLELRMKSYDNYDGVLINLITGSDIKLDDIKSLRKYNSGFFYLDVHSLARGIDKDLNRFPKVIEHFEEYANLFDAIQCNQYELMSLFNYSDKIKIIEKALSYRAKYIIVTKEDKGAELYFIEENKLKCFEEPALKKNVINKVGCGDIFGASFFYSYLMNRDKERALKDAIKASGIITEYKGLSDFVRLKEDFKKD